MLFPPCEQAPSHRRIRELRSPDRPHNELVERRASAQPLPPPRPVMWPHEGGEVLGEAAACAVWLFRRPWDLAASIFSADLFFIFPLFI